MSFLNKIFKKRASPKDLAFPFPNVFPLGNTFSGKRVTERSAMCLTAVYACVRVLSEAVAGLPLHLYRRTERGKEKATSHPLYFLLADEPNPETTSFVFRETLMTHLLLWGNAYAQITRNGKGEIMALYPLLPSNVTPQRDESGNIIYQYTVPPDAYPKDYRNMTVNLSARDEYSGARKPPFRRSGNH